MMTVSGESHSPSGLFLWVALVIVALVIVALVFVDI